MLERSACDLNLRTMATEGFFPTNETLPEAFQMYKAGIQLSTRGDKAVVGTLTPSCKGLLPRATHRMLFVTEWAWRCSDAGTIE